MWTIGGAARDELGGGRAEPGVLRGLRADSGEGSHLGALFPDGDSGDVKECRYLDHHGKDEGTDMHPRKHMG